MKRAEMCYQLMASVWETDFDAAREVENATVVAAALGGTAGEVDGFAAPETPSKIWTFPDESKLSIADDGSAASRVAEEDVEAA